MRSQGIQPASGLIDEIVLLSLENPNQVTAFTFWRSKEDSDRFDGFDEALRRRDCLVTRAMSPVKRGDGGLLAAHPEGVP
jgi:hypothetical protein